jgi:hypothetical protein
MDMLPKATGTEILPYHKYHRSNKLESALIPGLVVGDDTEGTMVCPRCQARRDGIKHGAKATCSNCTLKMQRWGNGLHLLG